MLVMIIAFVVLMFIGVPLLFSMGLSSVIYFFATGNISLLSIIPERFLNGMDSFVIMAIPLFTFMGLIMSEGGLSNDLIDFVNIFVGRFRGGLAYTNVFVSTLFGGISGSAFADVSSECATLIPVMEKTGYDREFSASLTVASSVQSPLIPPSIPALVVSGIAGVSVASVFMSGLVPGLLMSVVCAIVVFIRTKQRNYPKFSEKFTLKAAWLATRKAIFALLTPVIIMGGVLLGFFTVTESAAIAVTYSVLICFFVKKIKWKEFFHILKETVRSSAMTYILLAIIQVFAWIIANEQIPRIATTWLLSLSSNVNVLLFFLMLFLIVWGMFMDVTAAILIFGPLLFPVFVGLGVHPVQLGAILIFLLCIGLQTPPFGTLLFVVSSLTRTSFTKLVKEMVPYYIGEVILLVLIVYIPDITLTVPRLLGLIN